MSATNRKRRPKSCSTRVTHCSSRRSTTVYEEALAYQKLLATQIGDIKVSCAQGGVSLTLDGQPFATCPAQETRRVLAGPHQIVGTKQGLLPKTLELVVVGGRDQGVDIKLDPLAKGAKIVHRWPGYVPWTVFGSGFAVGAVGGLVLVMARNSFRSYDNQIDANCTDRCTAEERAPFEHYREEGKRYNNIGGVLVGVGATAVATGVVMVYLNRGRTVYPEVAPMAGTVSISGSW